MTFPTKSSGPFLWTNGSTRICGLNLENAGPRCFGDLDFGILNGGR